MFVDENVDFFKYMYSSDLGTSLIYNRGYVIAYEPGIISCQAV